MHRCSAAEVRGPTNQGRYKAERRQHNCIAGVQEALRPYKTRDIQSPWTAHHIIHGRRINNLMIPATQEGGDTEA